MSTLQRIAFLLSTALVFSGCAIGYDRLLFATKTNVGLDIDTKPPTAELSIARREGVIAPSYGDGKTLSVLAGFRFDGLWINPQISSAFAGGTPAVILGRYFVDEDPSVEEVNELDGTLCLAENPGLTNNGDSPWKKITEWFGEKQDPVRPFYFATDTAFGLKVAWSGATSAVPDTLKLGYNRKEFAYAPIFANQADCKLDGDEIDEARDEEEREEDVKTYRVDVPAFIAIVDNSSNTRQLSEGTTAHSQFFATGEAATYLARRREVRQVLYRQMAPGIAELTEREGGGDGGSPATEEDPGINKHGGVR